MPLPTVLAARYVTPLREGGSLPAVIEDAEGAFWAVKFRGAGQGARALIAEVIVGEIARALGLPVPTIAEVELDAAFGRSEPDPEIQDILVASRGTNIGLAFLDGAYNYDPLAGAAFVPEVLAAQTVWLDAFVTNIDRTPRNPNLLLWGDGEAEPGVWLIDHGAALYFHHDWDTADAERARRPFAPIKDHVLLPLTTPESLEAANAQLAPLLSPSALDRVLACIPDGLLTDAPPGRPAPFESPEATRDAYRAFLSARLQGPRAFAAEAVAARIALGDTPDVPLPYRR